MSNINKQLIEALQNRQNSADITNLLADFLPTESKQRFLDAMVEQNLLPNPKSKMKVFEVLWPNDRKSLHLVAAKTKKDLALIFNCSPSTLTQLASEISNTKDDFLLATENFGTIFKKDGRFKGDWVAKETYKIKPCSANSGMKELWLSNLYYGNFKNESEIEEFLKSQ